MDIEAPLPVVLVQAPGEHRSLVDTPPPGSAPWDASLADAGGDDMAYSDEAAGDEEVSEAYDAALSSVRGTGSVAQPAQREDRTLLMGDARTLLMGDARTRLRLDLPSPPSEDRSFAEQPAAKPSEPVVPTKSRRGEEERTHLLLDSLDLKDERETAWTRLLVEMRPFARRVLRLGLTLDELLHGRWGAALAALGVAAGILPPLFDYLTDDPDSTASLLSSLGVFVALSVFALAWLGPLRRDDGVWDSKVVVVRVQTALRLALEDAQALARSPGYLKLQVCGELLSRLGLAGTTLAACRSAVRWLLGETDPPSLLRWSSGVLLVGGVVLLRAARRRAPVAAPGPLEIVESVQAASKLPPIVDLSLPLPTSFVGEDTPLNRVVFALSEWRGQGWLDAAGYRAALERHLQRHLPGFRVERERWMGGSRSQGVADLVVGDLVLIELAHGFRQHSAERTIAALRARTRTWPGKPMVLAVFEASREVLFEGDATAALFELHESLPMLTVRMPTRS